jgi:hypothetical protein
MVPFQGSFFGPANEALEVISASSTCSRARTRDSDARQRIRQRQTRMRPALPCVGGSADAGRACAGAGRCPAGSATERASARKRSCTIRDGGAKPLRVFCSNTHVAARAWATKSRAARCHGARLEGVSVCISAKASWSNVPCQERTRASRPSAPSSRADGCGAQRVAKKHAAMDASPPLSSVTATAMYRARALYGPRRSQRRARQRAEAAARSCRRTSAAAVSSAATCCSSSRSANDMHGNRARL